jgi:hypothetical protein
MDLVLGPRAGVQQIQELIAELATRNGMTAVHPPRPSRLALVNGRNGGTPVTRCWAIDDFAPQRLSAPLRFVEPFDPNAPLTVPLASYQTAPSPDNDA